MNINELSIKEKIGQKLLVGINSSNIDDIIYLIRNNYIGGVVLYKKNYENYKEMLDVVKKIRDANANNKVPLFIAIDQENGVVNRFPNEVTPLKNIYDISQTDKKLIRDVGRITADFLVNTGINMNLAPVLDIYNESDSKVLNKRCFYGDENNIYEDAKDYLKEFNDRKIITVCKHFPGHGVTKVDSHFFVPYIFNYKKILNKHVIPFKKAISDGVDAIMVGHLVIRKLSPFIPASISSKFINRYLREECGYNGVVISDEVNMLSKNIIYKFCYLNRAFKSNSDIIMIKVKNKDTALKIINKAYKILSKCDIDYSVKRIISLKEKYKLDDNLKFNGCDIDSVNKDIVKINNKVT